MIWNHLHPALRRPILFAFGGGINTVFSYLIYLMLNEWLNYQLSYFIGYFFGILLAYWFNTIVVFNASLSWKSLFSYPLVYIVQYASSAIFLGALIEKTNISISFAPVLVTVVMLPATYMMNKLIIGRTK